MRFRCLFLSFMLAAALALPQIGLAQPKTAAPKSLGAFSAWKAYADGGADQPVCYMTLLIHAPPGKKLKRGAAWLMITHRPAENSKDVVSYAAGYSFKLASDVTIDIGKKSFDLFTQKGTAWSRDAATDHALAAAIRDGAILKATGTPATKDVPPVTDTLDLKGAGAAYRAIGKACGYPEDRKQTTDVRKKKSNTNKKTP